MFSLLIFQKINKYEKLIIIILKLIKMSNPPNIPFFFYKNFTEPENLNKICHDYTVSDGIVRVYDFNSDRTRICFSKNNKENKIILDGKIVSFPISNKEIISKLGMIGSCKLGKDIYKMTQIVAIDHNNQEITCAIIY